MKRTLLVLFACLMIPAAALAKSSAQLELSGRVQEKLDFKLVYDRPSQTWRLTQTTNGSLRATLVKTKNFSSIVSVRAP